MSVVFSNCMDCIHLKNSDKHDIFLCDAFPIGIPKEHMFRKNQDKKMICNNNIKFESEKKE